MTPVADPLPVLRPAVRADAAGRRGCRATGRGRGARLPDQPGRPVPEGLDRRRGARGDPTGSPRRWCAGRRDGRAGPRADAGTRRSTSSPRGSRALQREHGPDAVAVFGGGGLTNEKAYTLGKFARVVLRTPNIDYNGRFCMSSAAAAGQPDVRRRPRAAVPARRPRRRGRRAARRPQPRRDDAAARPAPGRGAARGGLVVVDPRRIGHRRAHRRRCRRAPRSPCPAPTSSLLLALPHVLVAEGLADDDVRRRPHHRAATPCARSVEPVVARAGRGGSRGPRRRAARDRASPRGRGPGARRARRLRAHRPRRRAARPRAPTRSARRSTWRSRSACPAGVGSGYGPLTGQGNGQGGARARAEGRPAARLPEDRRPGGPRARRRGVGRRPRRPARARACPPSSCWPGSARPGGPRALLVHGSNLVVSAPERRPSRERAGRARPARRLRLRAVRDRRARRRRAAGDPVGRGGGHDDDARGPRRCAAAGRRRRPAARAVRAGGARRARDAARPPPSAIPTDPRRSSTSCARASAGGPRRLLGAHLRPARRGRGPVLAVPGAAAPAGHPAAVPRPLRDRRRPGPARAPSTTTARPTTRAPTPAVPRHRTGAARTTSRAPRPAGSPSSSRPRPGRSSSSTRCSPTRLGIVDGGRRARHLRARRARRAGRGDRRDPPGHGLPAVPLGRRPAARTC